MSTNYPLFSIEQLRKMWFRKFHKAGDIYFDHLSEEETCRQHTEDEFQDFLEQSNTIDPPDTDNV